MKALEVAAGLVSLGVLLYAGAVVFFPHQSAPFTALAKRPVRVRRNAKALAMAYPEGVNESRWLAVGGRQQWVTLRGAHVANPVLVIIHGGPASSYIPFNPQLRGWEKHFTVLQWDQRGAGQTYLGQGADDKLTLDQLVADGRDLVGWVSSQLPQAEVVLVGSSVGTVIATRIAEQAPHLVDRLVLMDALGPGARAESWRLTRDALHARGRTKDVMALDAVGSDPIGWTAEQAETGSKLATWSTT